MGAEWRVELVARRLAEEKAAAAQAALAALGALPGTEVERWQKRWAQLDKQLTPGCSFLSEARLRLEGGVTASGLPRRPVGGRFNAFAAEWARLTDDEEVLRWMRPVEDGGGVNFDPSDDFVESNSAVSKDGHLRRNDGNGQGVADNMEFVAFTIEEMLESHCVQHLGRVGDSRTVVPRAVCPLGCAPKANGKLRLYHDARAPNVFLDAGSLTLETLSRMRHVFSRNGWLVLADASAAYWHVALTWAASLLCGFCFQGHYFVWLVLPFGINLAPRVYCKLSLIIFTSWRRSCVLPYEERQGHSDAVVELDAAGRPAGWPVVIDASFKGKGMTGITYIDDIGLTPEERRLGRWWAVVVLLLLVRLGFSCSWAKCQWEPVQAAKVLGVWVDLVEFVFKVVPKQVAAIKELCELVVATAIKGDRMRTRTLARLCGKVMSCYLAVGDPAWVMTKHMYGAIALATRTPPHASRRVLKVAWDSLTGIPQAVQEEAAFWLEMIDVVHGVEISPSAIAARLVQTGGVDTGDEATGGYLVDHVGKRTLLTFLEPLQEGESSDSSTVRELRGLRRLISALHGRFSRKVLQPLMDTQCGVRALVRGSRSPLVHAEAVLVLKEAIRAGLRLRPVWLPREMVEIRIADGLGKEDEQVRQRQDLQLDPAVFAAVNAEWGPLSIDLFADAGNALLPRFYSRHFTVGCVDADAFAHDWSKEFAWANPPHAVIPMALHHASVVCKARLVLLVPWWEAAPWWPMVSTGDAVRRVRRIAARPGLIRRHGGSWPLAPTKFDFAAVLLDFSSPSPVKGGRHARREACRTGGRWGQKG